MKPYSDLPACQGDCQQGPSPCKSWALCRTSLHRVTPAQVVDREYNEITMEDDVSFFSRGTLWAAIGMVVLAAVAALTLGWLTDNWPVMLAVLG